MARSMKRAFLWWGWWVLLVCVLGVCGFLWGQEASGGAEAEEADVAEASQEASSVASEASVEAEADAVAVVSAERPTMEALKKLVVEKNIFKAGKAVYSAGSESTLPVADLGPQRLKKPFRVDAIVREMGEPKVFLSFGETSKPKLAHEGDVFEEMVRIVSIGGAYIVCEYGGREIRIGTNESSDDAWGRLVGEGKEYVFGWSVLEDGNRAAAYLFEPGEASLPIKVGEGEYLGQAEVVQIEATRVHLLLADGSVETIE